MEFRKTIFQAWKVMDNSEVMEDDHNVMLFYRSCRSLRTANELVVDCCDICKYV